MNPESANATPTALRFRVAGFPVAIHPSFFLVTLALGSRRSGAAFVVEWFAVVFVSILVHELGHAVVARASLRSRADFIALCASITPPVATSPQEG